MDKEKLWKGNELIDRHERYDKLASMLSMLIDYNIDGEPATTHFRLAVTDGEGVRREQHFDNDDVALIRDLIKVVREYDNKVLKEFEEL